jgi:hypothetical protein
LEVVLKKTKHIMIGLVGLILVLTTGVGIAQEPQTLSRAVLKIDRLTSGESFNIINSGFASLEGFSGIGANLFRKLIAIDFTAPLTGQKISEMLSLLGYPGKLESVDVISEKESFAYLEYKRTGSGSCGGGSCGVTPPPSSSQNNKSQPEKSLPQTGGSCCSLPVTEASQSTQDL